MAHPTAERETTFQRGLLAYRAGNHYDAHEIWEELWESEESDDHRRFLQALIQVASAIHKLTHDVGPRGALRLLDSARAKLEARGDVRFDGETCTIPGWVRLATLYDLDGNTLMLYEDDAP